MAAASLALPEGWVDRTVLTYVGPDQGAGSPSLVVTSDRLGPDVALGRYAAMQDAAMRAGMEGIDLVEERETTVAGRPAVRLTYSWRWEQRAMRQRVWCLTEDGVGYAITATAAEDEFETHRAAFAAAVGSFQIGE